MGLSVLERIAINVEATLKTLVTQNGYQLTITRAKQVNEPAHLTGYIFQIPATDIADAATSTDEWKQTFAIVIYVMPTESDTTPVDTYNNDINASVYEALMADYTRGGLALQTKIMPALYFPPFEGDTAGITFMFDVHYRTKLDNPYVSPFKG